VEKYCFSCKQPFVDNEMNVVKDGRIFHGNCFVSYMAFNRAQIILLRSFIKNRRKKEVRKMSGFERCPQCRQWINTLLNRHTVFVMRDGTTKHTHLTKNKGCSDRFQDAHCAEILTAQRVEFKQKEVIEPKDYAT